MATPSADGAAAAASHFMSVLAYAKATNDLTEWDALSSPECSFCAGIRGAIVARSERGHRNVGAVDVTSAEGIEIDAGRWYTARLQVTVDESVDVDRSGDEVESHPREELHIDVVMTWDGDSWVIDEVGPAAVPTP